VTKHRVELFSDGVFAIVLTLLVLDLRVPAAHGLAGLIQIAPALLVHAAAFFMIGVFWLTHHGILARVTEVRSRTLMLNLVALFWITLIPFGAKNAAEHPFEPLGPSLISACCGGYLLALLAARLSAHSTIDDNPTMRAWRIGRIVIVSTIVAVDLLCAALAWLAPWAGYAASLATVAICVLLPSPPEVEQAFQRREG
jgi:uncharacterized membrane protein